MSEPVINIVTRKVREGKEGEFEQILNEFVKKSLGFPGLQGVNIIRPTPGTPNREYGILRFFDSESHRKDFYSSKFYSEWESKVSQYCENVPKPRVVTGLEAWFTLPGQEMIKPPLRWKMTLVTILGVYPLALIIPIILKPIIHPLPNYIATLISSACLVSTLTWIVMPNLTKLLKLWLHK